MFTSGSTGIPKGVAISHLNLLNFIQWTQNAFDVQPTDVFANVNPLFFDNSVFDIYSSLFSGASIVPFDSETMRKPHEILRRVETLQCTTFFSVPSLLIYFQTLNLITSDAFNTVNKIVFGGEGYPKSKLVDLYRTLCRRITLFNVYGPTECTCICSVYRIGDSDFHDLEGYPSLGKINRHFSCVIVDDEGKPVPNGEVVELLLGGPCVGPGYFNAPEQNSAVFVQNPTHSRFLDRVYRTGDLVKCDPVNGKISFIGRRDTQVKQHGYRIELGEIENALLSLPSVNEAVALQCEIEGNKSIVVVVAAKTGDSASEIRQHISNRLPRYMVPAHFIVVAELMKNSNGKLDRKQILEAVRAGKLHPE